MPSTGCDTDSPDDGSDVREDADATSVPDRGEGGGGLNGALSGQLIIERRLLDLPSGRLGDELAPAALRVNRLLSASRDGRNLYYIRLGCRDRPGALSYDCVVVLDPSGTEIDRLDPGLDLSVNAPDVSPDGRFLAVGSTEIHGVHRVVILDADGQVIDDADRTFVPDSMGWGPDGTLYYLAGNSVIRATVGDIAANDERLIRFDEALGSPRALSVSPDGTRFAVEFDAGEGVTEQAFSVWLMNADGGELRRFATVSAGSQPTVRNPIWSPDGRWLLVSAGGFSLFTGRPTPSSPDFGGGLFALDTSVASHALDTFGTGDAGAQILVRSACDEPDGCEFGADRHVNGWLP